jgi:bacterioferritin-associated ferredoxin
MLTPSERNGPGVFACICRAVTSDEVGAAIDNGAATLAAVAKATRACTGCGMCRDRIRAMLGERGEPRQRVAVPASVSAG